MVTEDVIIEYIGKNGFTRVSPFSDRINVVKGGDIIEVPDVLLKYPISYKYCRICNVDKHGVAKIVDGMGSAFLMEDGDCDISGGPFFSMPVSLLTPTGTLHETTYWNWRDNLPGAGMGVHFQIKRPIHRLNFHPYDLKYRYERNEERARHGQFNHEEYLSKDEYELFYKSNTVEIRDEYYWIFKKIVR